jgi:hypothetical protein
MVIPAGSLVAGDDFSELLYLECFCDNILLLPSLKWAFETFVGKAG